MSVKRKGLGKGLDALLGLGGDAPDADAALASAAQQSTREMPVELLCRGQYQPRRDMRQDSLEELAESIRRQGVIQPVVVRPVGVDKYEIIAGERRWRAAQLAGLATIPVIIRDVPDQAAIAMALIENIQREDLNPVEESRALLRLQDEFGLTQQQVADAVGKSRATVANLMRLSTLSGDVYRMLEHGDLDMGHGRALLALSGREQIDAAHKVVQKGLSVRQTEELVRSFLKRQTKQQERAPHKPGTHDVSALEEKLAEQVGLPVRIQHQVSGRGRLIFSYNSLDELDGLLSHIK